MSQNVAAVHLVTLARERVDVHPPNGMPNYRLRRYPRRPLRPRTRAVETTTADSGAVVGSLGNAREKVDGLLVAERRCA